MRESKKLWGGRRKDFPTNSVVVTLIHSDDVYEFLSTKFIESSRKSWQICDNGANALFKGNRKHNCMLVIFMTFLGKKNPNFNKRNLLFTCLIY